MQGIAGRQAVLCVITCDARF